MPVHFDKPTPHTIHLDEEPIRLHLQRMSVGQFEEFNAIFTAFGSGRSTPGPEPVAPSPVDLDSPARGLALADLRVRASAEAAVAEENAEWIRSVFGAYVHVEAGDLTIGDEVVTDGARFLDAMIGMVGYQAIVSEVLAELWLQHRLTPAQKKTLQSRPASATGSSGAPQTAIPGAKPVTAATSAASGSSAPRAAATAPSSDASSGMTARPRRSGPAQSGSSPRRRTSPLASSNAATPSPASASVG